MDGDVSNPNLGLSARSTSKSSAALLDLIVNSSGLTDFNPDLRDALAVNVRSTAYVLDFLTNAITPRCCTSPPATYRPTRWPRPGRIPEKLHSARHTRTSTRVKEWESLENVIRETEARAESARSNRRAPPQPRKRKNTPPKTCKARRSKIRSAKIASAGSAKL